MPRLIVNADDFGLTSGINRAIIELHGNRLLTSATLMARAAATPEAIELAKATPTLGVGCHIVLVDGEPSASAQDVASLISGEKQGFNEKLGPFLTGLYSGRIRPAEIEREARAQIEYLLKAGVKLTHIDTHKHTHMFPRVLRPVLRAARECGIGAVRNPFEPPWAVRSASGGAMLRAGQIMALRLLRSTWHRIIAEEGFTTTDGTIAVTGTGILDGTTLRKLLTQLPEGRWELVTHPGYNDADLDRVRTRLRASRDVERKALEVSREFPALELISFADLYGSAGQR